MLKLIDGDRVSGGAQTQQRIGAFERLQTERALCSATACVECGPCSCMLNVIACDAGGVGARLALRGDARQNHVSIASV
jgi:hypothetical protein